MDESNKDSIATARGFISFGDLLHINDEWNAHGFADFSLSRGQFEQIVRILQVGIGELSKNGDDS